MIMRNEKSPINGAFPFGFSCAYALIGSNFRFKPFLALGGVLVPPTT